MIVTWPVVFVSFQKTGQRVMTGDDTATVTSRRGLAVTATSCPTNPENLSKGTVRISKTSSLSSLQIWIEADPLRVHYE